MMINKRTDEPPGAIPPPPPNPLQVRVEAIRAKTMACKHCDKDGWARKFNTRIRKYEIEMPREKCKVCSDERALLDVIDELMEACEER